MGLADQSFVVAGLGHWVGFIELFALHAAVIAWCVWEYRKTDRALKQDGEPNPPSDDNH